MTTAVTYSVMSYETAFRALGELLRQILPDYTEQDPYDLLQDLRAMVSWLAERDAALVDRVASGLFWNSYLTRAEAVALASLVGYRLRRESPGKAPVVAKLTAALSGGPTLLIEEGAQVGTRGDDGEAAIIFEQAADLLAYDTAFDGADNYGGDVFLYDSAAGTFVDFNAAGAADEVWPQGALGDAAYFGHPHLMFLELALTFTSHVTEAGVWELYDPLYSFAPGPDESGPDAAVGNNGDGTITFRVDTYTGSDRYEDGTFTMEVLCIPTGVSEACVVTWNSGSARNEITTSSALGQSTVSTDPADYEIRPYWVTPANLTDGTDSGSGPLDQDGSVTWDLPQTTTRAWTKREVNGVEAYWMRCRRAGAAGTDKAELATVAGGSVSDERWWLFSEFVQGETVVEDIGTGDGTPLQRLALSRADYIEGSLAITVDGTPWDVLTSTYGLGPSDQGCVLVEDPDGTLYVAFGDGLTGAIPQASEEIIATYRTGATRNGNVGIGTVTRPQQSLPGLDGWTNPRAATGWRPRDGYNTTDLNRLRLWVPGFARTGDKVVTPEDASYHAVEKFVTEAGTSPIARADFIESSLDAAVLDGYVVGPDGGTVSAADLAEGERYFNGRLVGLQRDGGVMLANQQVALRNVTLVSVDVTVSIAVLAGYSGGVAAAVKAALRAWLKPLAIDDDGQYVHRNGGKVSRGRLMAIISDAAKAVAGKGFSDITLTTPATTTNLSTGELPTPGTLNVTVTEES